MFVVVLSPGFYLRLGIVLVQRELEFADRRVVQDGGFLPGRSGIVPEGFTRYGTTEGKNGGTTVLRSFTWHVARVGSHQGSILRPSVCSFSSSTRNCKRFILSTA